MSAPDGWYPDPGGAPETYRYWDGRAWSAVTGRTPAAPPPFSHLGGTGSPGRAAPGARGLLPTRGRSARWWLLAGAALLGALVLIVVLGVRNLDRVPTVDPRPGPAPSPADPCPPADASATPVPSSSAGNRVRSGKLSYVRLPPPFGAPKPDYRVPFGREVQGQTATVEAADDNSPSWEAGVLVARLLAGDGFFGPRQGAQLVTECITGLFYGDAEVAREDRRNAATSVDGNAAWLIESHLTFDVPGVRTKGETLIVVVVDTANGEAGLYYASNPDTSPQHDAPIRGTLASLRVED